MISKGMSEFKNLSFHMKNYILISISKLKHLPIKTRLQNSLKYGNLKCMVVCGAIESKKVTNMGTFLLAPMGVLAQGSAHA